MNSQPDLISPQKSSSSNEVDSHESKYLNQVGKNDMADEFVQNEMIANPNTGKGAFVGVIISCFMVAFGGFVLSLIHI